MAKKQKISFIIPDNFQQELREQVVKDGYGLRGKSIWVGEAISNLLELSNYPELVNFSDGMKNLNKTETIVVDYLLSQSIFEALLKIRQEFPTLEGVKSRIVRTAILQRLLRS